MQYREIVAVTGLAGLYQLLATKADGAIVRSLADNSTKFISARLHNVTPLESIEVYTTGDNVRLHHVFQKMQESSANLADNKKGDNTAVKEYFQSVFPDFDEDRVYVSDMKKMVKWYDILKGADMLKFDEPQTDGEATDAAAEEAPKAKAKKTKSAEAEETADVAVAEAEEKPAKKARAKKSAETTEDGEEKPKKAARKKKTEE